MRTIKWTISTGFAGEYREGEFEVDNDTPETEIAEMAKEEAFNEIDWSWEYADEEEAPK